jgi:hypothetical protein
VTSANFSAMNDAQPMKKMLLWALVKLYHRPKCYLIDLLWLPLERSTHVPASLMSAIPKSGIYE